MKRLERRVLQLAPCGIPLAWRQISSDRKRLLAALAGVSFGVILMLFQQGIYKAGMQMVIRPLTALDGDLLVVSRNFEFTYSSRPFPERRIYQTLSDPDVVSASPLVLQLVTWRNPLTGVQSQFEVFGVYPGRNPFRLPAIASQSEVFADPEGILFDEMSAPDFGPVGELYRKDGPFYGEVAGRRVRVLGLFAMGKTLIASGHGIVGMENFLRLTRRPEHQCDIGVIKLRAGADPSAVSARLAAALPSDVQVVTRGELERREKRYWARRTPVGFIIIAGMLVAMLVGAVIVYQILYTDISNHLHEYATLKALGMADPFFMGLVVQEAVLLVGISFPPAIAVCLVLFRLADRIAGLPTRLTVSDTAIVILLAAVMSLVAGLLATRRLRSADPAEVFS